MIHAVAVRDQLQADAGVRSERGQHVVEEVDVGFHRHGTAVEREPQVDPRLLRLAADVRAAAQGDTFPALLPFVPARVP